MKKPYSIESERDDWYSSGLDLIDEIGDAFTPPEFMELSEPISMFEARMEDIHEMRNYFRKAIAELGLDSEISSKKSEE